jgi:transposase
MKRLYSKRPIRKVLSSPVGADRAGMAASVGVDVGKDTLELVVRWSDEQFEQPVTVCNPMEVPRAIEWLKRLEGGRRLSVAMESSGTYGDSFRQACSDAGLTVLRVGSKATHDYAEVFDGVPSQHDGKDAAVIAELSALGKAAVWKWEVGSETEQTLRLQADAAEAYAEQFAMWCGRIEGWLGRHWPEIAGVWGPSRPTLHRILEHYGSPTAVAADAEAASRIRQWGGPLLKSKTIAMVLAAARSTVGVRCTAVDQLRIRSYVAEASATYRAWRLSKGELARLAEGNETITRMASGVGLSTAAVLYARLGAPQRYTCGRAYVKAMGLNLRECSSGRQKNRGIRISKRGCPQARRWLFLAALRLIRCPDVRRWYLRKVARQGGRRLPAVVAIMRKVAMGLWRSAHDGVPFDPGRLFAPSPPNAPPARGMAVS